MPLPKLLKHSALLGILLGCCSGALGQLHTIEWSTSISIPKSEDVLKISLVDANQPVLISKFGETLIVRKFDENEADDPIFLRTASDASLLDQHIGGDQITLLERMGDSKRGKYRIRKVQLTRDSVEERSNIPFELSRKHRPGFQNEVILTVSENGAFTAVCQQQAYSKSAQSEFNVLIADSAEANVFHLPSEYDSDDIELLGATIDASGIVYLGMLAGVKLNSPFRRRYLIYSFNPFDSVMTEFDMSSQDLFIRDVVIRSTKNGLKVAALYNSDPLEDKKVTGYIYVKLTPDGKEIEKRIVSTFDPAIIEAYEGIEATPETGIASLHVYDVMDLGGTPVLALEKYYQDQICTADPRTGMLNCTDQFHYDAITLIDLDQQQPIASIGKKQLDYDRRSIFSSQVSTNLSNGEIVLFYNDHFKNSTTNAERVMNNPNRSAIRYFKLGRDRRVKSNFLSFDRQTDMVFTPKYGVATYADSIFVLSVNNKQMRVGRIEASKL